MSGLEYPGRKPYTGGMKNAPNDLTGPGRPRNDPGIGAWCGDALRLRRLSRGLTAAEVAEAVGVGKSTVTRWEVEEGAPPAGMVMRLAALMECSLVDFSRPPRIL